MNVSPPRHQSRQHGLNVPNMSNVPRRPPPHRRLRVLEAEGLSLQTIANRLNTEGVPTFSGKGRWQKGTIVNLLAQYRQGTDVRGIITDTKTVIPSRQ
jgi:hypothetical protein